MNPDYLDILSAFIKEQTEFLVVGAYALAFHGIPRATGDIDLWVGTNNDNAKKVYSALSSFGAPLKDLSYEDFTKPDLIFQIGVAPRRIDILTGIDGVDFDEAVAEAETIEIGDILIPVISRRHLIDNKRESGRPQDTADIARLESE